MINIARRQPDAAKSRGEMKFILARSVARQSQCRSGRLWRARDILPARARLLFSARELKSKTSSHVDSRSRAFRCSSWQCHRGGAMKIPQRKMDAMITSSELAAPQDIARDHRNEAVGRKHKDRCRNSHRFAVAMISRTGRARGACRSRQVGTEYTAVVNKTCSAKVGGRAVRMRRMATNKKFSRQHGNVGGSRAMGRALFSRPRVTRLLSRMRSPQHVTTMQQEEHNRWR